MIVQPVYVPPTVPTTWPKVHEASPIAGGSVNIPFVRQHWGNAECPCVPLGRRFAVGDAVFALCAIVGPLSPEIEAWAGKHGVNFASASRGSTSDGIWASGRNGPCIQQATLVALSEADARHVFDRNGRLWGEGDDGMQEAMLQAEGQVHFDPEPDALVLPVLGQDAFRDFGGWWCSS